MNIQDDGDREADELEASIDAAEGPQVRYLGDVQRLFYKPGDVIVLSTDHNVSGATAERLKDYVETNMPGTTCFVLGGGLRIAVLSRSTTEREPLAEALRAACHDAIARALLEGGVTHDVLRGMCLEVGLEAFDAALNQVESDSGEAG